jgi:hypothetical protein
LGQHRGERNRELPLPARRVGMLPGRSRAQRHRQRRCGQEVNQPGVGGGVEHMAARAWPGHPAAGRKDGAGDWHGRVGNVTGGLRSRLGR